MRTPIRLLAVCSLLLLSSFAATRTSSANDVDARRKQLDALLKDQWEYVLRTSPEFASILGDKRYNDQLSDFSQAAIERDQKVTRDYLKKFEAIDTTGFPEQEKLNKDLMVRNLRNSIADEKFKGWEMPVTQFGGIHIDFPQLISSLSFSSVKDYDDFIARLKQLPRAFDENLIQMRKGMKDNLMPPQVLLTQVAEQAENIAKLKPEDTPFTEPLKNFPKDFSDADKKRITEALITAVRDSALPAYKKFLAFVRTEYAPKGRKDIGIWSLPNGDERYRTAVKRMTTTDMTPEQVHQLGLSEVTRIEMEETAIAKKLGFNDLAAFRKSLKDNPDLHPKSRQAIIDQYNQYESQMWAKLPELFGRLPKAKLEVRPIPEYVEKQSATHYDQGTPDGSRPGHVFVNTYDFANQLDINNESTAYHEGVPGHHMQIAIAQELPELPPFRQNAFYTAFIEGWALYSERLGKEVGFYQNPYSDYGRLDDEMLRAVRLVVDTGAHYKHWTREQMVQYMRDHTSVAEAGIQSETDRYIAWPGQALAYKVGQLTILRLREKAKQELGEKFDLRAFHDEVLGAGPLPLDVLEKRINDWIAEKKKTAGISIPAVALMS
jgi:uncharacterized protein (DUF885 family)